MADVFYEGKWYIRLLLGSAIFVFLAIFIVLIQNHSAVLLAPLVFLGSIIYCGIKKHKYVIALAKVWAGILLFLGLLALLRFIQMIGSGYSLSSITRSLFVVATYLSIGYMLFSNCGKYIIIIGNTTKKEPPNKSL